MQQGFNKMDNSELYAAIFATIDSLKAAQERQAAALETIASLLTQAAAEAGHAPN